MNESELDPRLEWIVAELRRPVEVDPAGRMRLLELLREEPRPHREGAPWRWILRPRPVSLTPLATSALAAGLVGLGVLLGLRAGRHLDDAGGELASRAGAVDAPAVRVDRVVSRPDVMPSDGTVKFVLVAPQAAQVSVVGDFNGWNPSATPMQRTGGTWVITVPLQPGRHLYAFVLNGNQWMPDPAAPLAPEDGFGVSNSVVLVGGSSS